MVFLQLLQKKLYEKIILMRSYVRHEEGTWCSYVMAHLFCKFFVHSFKIPTLVSYGAKKGFEMPNKDEHFSQVLGQTLQKPKRLFLTPFSSIWNAPDFYYLNPFTKLEIHQNGLLWPWLRGLRHLTENQDLRLWVQSLAHVRNVSTPDCKIINKAPSARVIVICSDHTLNDHNTRTPFLFKIFSRLESI